MTSEQFSPTGLTSREKTTLLTTAVLFASAVTLAALGLPVDEVLVLVGGTAGTAVGTVTAMALAGAVRSAREAKREAIVALARLAGQP
ncbi:hypothetical protein OG345_41195 (plasmid) [Streptomyces sp. NBC_01220]|uniref:hypothetical protein n=1 Tax=unclassified Streptomyces TaxID=2593676 RepID=UPI0029B57B1A|nr:hypothetical protein [Streptomyces sp. NRRL_B-2557]MDX2748532.1 hypothetical protein [Streptomyces sp. NRRL_B-2557]WSQ49423.1 hypothetical protein OG345_41195 [Streptomyces sp. NBC_01220]